MFICYSHENFKDENQQMRGFLYTNYSIGPHLHEFYEMNIILQGIGTHCIENSTFPVKKGDVFIIPPMTTHSYFDTHNLEVYHILMRENFITRQAAESNFVPGFLQLTEIEPYIRQYGSNTMFLRLSSNQLLQLQNDLYFIDDNHFADEKLLPLKMHALWKMLYWLSGLLLEQMQHTKKLQTQSESAILDILEFIHQNYDKKLTIDLLCKKAFLSRSTFLRSFSNVCGCTPTQYINKVRCKKAVELLENAALSKTQIAHSCGFYDLSHMERTIKNTTVL